MTSKKYTTRPHIVEAIQLTEESVDDCVSFLTRSEPVITINYDATGIHLDYYKNIPSAFGKRHSVAWTADEGDYLIKHDEWRRIELMRRRNFEAKYHLLEGGETT